MIFDGARDADDPGLAHLDRLAIAGSIEPGPGPIKPLGWATATAIAVMLWTIALAVLYGVLLATGVT